ncbi:Hypothetical protein MexAM1_META2p0125 (plasmid) [Methylorubrum extorquens AM1]|uniref:Uncharacterized protein n=1 Tax=Methylorubrum extorquens (strain ATCC 14718 / DSM 1338 / JCM 2805 / NCIMB 9133 / AM1) TaxID=272630 RepID=C5B3M0_METEA|nr:Hypothetical protein MexAM1_META2p0125 [Methylorubrum extorquens AM1]
MHGRSRRPGVLGRYHGVRVGRVRPCPIVRLVSWSPVALRPGGTECFPRTQELASAQATVCRDGFYLYLIMSPRPR